MATTADQRPRERTGAGDYLGCRCENCKVGEYGLPSVAAGTDAAQARALLGDAVELDPADGRWVVWGAVWCPDCGDKRPRWVSDGEVAERREEEARGFLRGKSEALLVAVTGCSVDGVLQQEPALRAIQAALEENWGPLAEVIDRVVVLDEEYGTPTWGHPYWTAKLTHYLGCVASYTSKLPHPGNEFVSRPMGMAEEVEAEPPAEGSAQVRNWVLALAAMAVRWIIAIDARAQKEGDADAEGERVVAAMLDDVKRWSELAQGLLVPGDDEERDSIVRRGRRHWVAMSISAHPDAHPALARIGVAPATPEECEAIMRELAPDEPEPEEAMDVLLAVEVTARVLAEEKLGLLKTVHDNAVATNEELRAESLQLNELLAQGSARIVELNAELEEAKKAPRSVLDGSKGETKPPAKTGKKAKRAKKKAHRLEGTDREHDLEHDGVNDEQRAEAARADSDTPHNMANP